MRRFTVRQIEKQPEPSCMAELRREIKRITKESGQEVSNKDWSIVSGEQKQAMREALNQEQFGLCAYCMVRILSEQFIDEILPSGMKIEHFEPRDSHADRMFDWDNLLGVCGGIYHSPNGPIHHCDDSRGCQPLHVNPATSSPPHSEDVFQYNLTGKLSIIPCGDCGESDCPYCSDLKVLNLNADHLIQNRRSVLEDLQTELRKIGSKDESKIPKFLRDRYKLATVPHNNQLPPYAPVAAKYLQKKLRQRGLL